LENDKKMLAQGKISEKELIEIRKKRKKADQIRSRSRFINTHIGLGMDTLRGSRWSAWFARPVMSTSSLRV